MIKSFISLFLIIVSLNVFAQEDSLNLFRQSPQKNSKSNDISTLVAPNTLSISFNAISRGGITVNYERYFEEFHFLWYDFHNIAYSFGVGFSIKDFVGQYDLANKKLYFEDRYSKPGSISFGRFIETGAKYYFQNEIDGNYFSLMLSEIRNNVNRNIGNEYTIANDASRNYTLEYRSNEFKIAFGTVKGFGYRFYNDISLGLGFRLVEYNYLDIESNLIQNAIPGTSNFELVVNDSFSETTLVWVFLGWKAGFRF